MVGCFVWLPNFVPLFVPPDFVLLSSERLVSYQPLVQWARALLLFFAAIGSPGFVHLYSTKFPLRMRTSCF